MTRVAMTGAAGNIGRELLTAFDRSEHEVMPLTYSEVEDIDGGTLDVTDRDEVMEKLADVDSVIHLAGASSPSADWDAVLGVNVQGTKNVLDAAVENDIGRVVFPSSNHAVGRYNSPDDPDTEKVVLEAVRTVDSDTPTRPDSFYGVSKAACEGLTKYYADVRGLEVVNVRIGWYMSEDDLRDNTGDGIDPNKDRFARAMWLSPHDCRDVLLKASTADLPENPTTINAVSRNDDRFFSITGTMRTVGYEPRDNAAEILGE